MFAARVFNGVPGQVVCNVSVSIDVKYATLEGQHSKCQASDSGGWVRVWVTENRLGCAVVSIQVKLTPYRVNAEFLTGLDYS